MSILTLATAKTHLRIDGSASDADLLQKFKANCKFGGLDADQTQSILAQVQGMFKASTVSLSSLSVK